MIENILSLIPHDIINFFLTVVFALLIGLEQRQHYINAEFETRFGTDRTFTLLGILGYVLYIINPHTLIAFLGGGVAIALLLAIYYWQKITVLKMFGLTSVVIALITYCLAPLIYTQPLWLALLIVICVLVITEIKETLFEFTKKIDHSEFITLAKFLVLAGVVLPLLPNKPISAEINVSPFNFWVAIVAVSGISYLSYIVRKYVFPQSGTVLTGILGGIYSSTATTLILARKSKEMAENNKVLAAITLTSTMMYLRIFLLALFFNRAIAWEMAPAFAIITAASIIIAIYFLKFYKTPTVQTGSTPIIEAHSNPLELKTAVLFGTLFMVFAVATGFVQKHYGTGGINVLSFVVGVTDITPFVLNLFQSKWDIANAFIITAVLNATTSNNLLKLLYSISLSDKSIRKPLIISSAIIIVIGLLLAFVFPL